VHAKGRGELGKKSRVPGEKKVYFFWGMTRRLSRTVKLRYKREGPPVICLGRWRIRKEPRDLLLGKGEGDIDTGSFWKSG